MCEKFLQMKSGVCRSNTGYKCVAFDPQSLELRPVIFAVYSGYQPERGTFQGVHPGDILATVSWDRNGELYLIRAVDNLGAQGDRLDLNKEVELWSTLQAKHPWLNEWLEPQGRSGAWLPVSEDEYLSVKAKRNRIQKFLDRFGLAERFDVGTFEQDRKSDLCLMPRPLDVDLNEIQSKEYHWTGSLVSIHQSEEWWGSNGDGSATPLQIAPEFTSGSNYAHSETSHEDGNPGVVGWERFKFVIRVCHGVHCRDHSSYGHSVDVWQIK